MTVAQLLTRSHWNAMDLALTLLEQHNISDSWSVEFDRAKTRLGSCQYRKRVITLSSHYIAAHTTTMEEIQDTILHEIAHAIVGRGHGHNGVWQRKCIEIGAKPVRCGQAFPVEFRHAIVCPTCGQRKGFHRKPKRSFICLRCPHRSQMILIGAQP